MEDINIFYFDNDLGAFDEYNPRFVMEQKFVKQIISILSKKPGEFYTKETLKKKLKVCSNDDFAYAIELLSNISAISFVNDKINLNFPFFLARDVKKIKQIIIEHLKKNLDIIATGLNETKEILKIHYPDIDTKVALYHFVCGKIFDGFMFDYLEENQLLKQSFLQQNGRDYMLIGYSKEHLCKVINKKLLCSFNNARYKKDSLTSFGNAAGNRLDYFRYFKLRQINKLYGKFKKIDRDFHDIPEEEIVFNSLNVIKNIMNGQVVKDNIFLKHLKTMRYITKNHCLNVPVFVGFYDVLQQIQGSIVQNLGEIIIEDFKNVYEQIINSNISCLTHKIDKAQLLNEIWHLYFGLLNNLLVKNKTFARPKKFKGEGAYLKCVYLFDV